MASGNDEGKIFSESRAIRFLVGSFVGLCIYYGNDLLTFKDTTESRLYGLETAQALTNQTRFTSKDGTALEKEFARNFLALEKRVSRNEAKIERVPARIPPKWFEELVERMRKIVDWLRDRFHNLESRVLVLEEKCKK